MSERDEVIYAIKREEHQSTCAETECDWCQLARGECCMHCPEFRTIHEREAVELHPTRRDLDRMEGP
jgi:hypothetical protein